MSSPECITSSRSALPFDMSTTTFTPHLGAGILELPGGQSASGDLTSAVATWRRPFVATSPFTGAASGAASGASLRLRRAVTTTLAAPAWIPALALALVAFVLVGVVAGVSAVSVWTWRSLSPARTRPQDPNATPPAPPQGEPPAERSTGAARRPRRVVRDRSVGYDA